MKILKEAIETSNKEQEVFNQFKNVLSAYSQLRTECYAFASVCEGVKNLEIHGRVLPIDCDDFGQQLVDLKEDILDVYYPINYGGEDDEDDSAYEDSKEARKEAEDRFYESLGENGMKIIKESTLNEARWTYEVPAGIAKSLRRAINDEDYSDLREALKLTWRWINTVMPEQFDEDELESKIEDLDFLDVEPTDEYDVSQEDIEDNFNYELSDLYDFCDAMRIWIPLNESINEADLSTKEGTASNILAANMHEINQCTSPKEVAEVVDGLLTDAKKKEPKVAKLMVTLRSSKDIVKSYGAITNFILKGDGLGVIK